MILTYLISYVKYGAIKRGEKREGKMEGAERQTRGLPLFVSIFLFSAKGIGKEPADGLTSGVI